MGVYTQLCTPIFNYINMSLINKFEEGGSPRLYKRGNDDIELDNYIRQAESGFDNWLDRIDIKDKYKGAVRSAYQDMINRINTDPESFTARLGGGFTNTVGITNNPDEKGFDAYGIAAKYLGDTLRSMQVYNKPVVKSDKTKYSRHSRLIDSKLQSEILGDNPEYFVRLDPYDKKAGKRGLTNRYNYLASKLGSYRDSLYNWEFENDEDKKYAQDQINNVISILQDDNPDNDYFALGQLGLNNLGAYLYTGDLEVPQTTPQNAGTPSANGEGTPSSLNLDSPISLVDNSDKPVGEWSKNQLANGMRSFTNDDLLGWLQEYLSNQSDYDVNNNKYMRKLFPRNIPNFNTGQILQMLLQQMLDANMLVKVQDGIYYIPGCDWQGTGYVWDQTNRQIVNIDLNQIRSQKEGGVLKALGGANFPELKIENPPTVDVNSLYHSESSRKHNMEDYYSFVSPAWARLNYGTNPNNLDEEGNPRVWGAFDLLPGWQGSRHDRRTKNIGLDPQTPNINNAYQIQRRYATSGDMVKDVRTAFQDWKKTNPNGTYQDFVNFYNDRVQKARDLSITKYAKGYNNTEFQDLYNNFNWLYASSAAGFDPSKGHLGAEPDLSSVLGSTMYSRTPLAFNSDEDLADLRLGTFVDDDTTQFWINNEGKLELRQAPTKPTDPEKAKSLSDIFEGDVKFKTPPKDRTGLINQGLIDLARAGRLAASIYSNNRIAKIVDEQLRPKLHNTYELHSPITGAYSEMQLRNNQAADVMHEASRAISSDASLAAARLLAGQKQAAELQQQGFLKDDKEIARTREESLKRSEYNLKRRSDLANYNKDAIIDTNYMKAQLEASRLKKNWDSIDTYLKEQETNLRNKNDERDNFDLQNRQFVAQQEMQRKVDQVMDRFKAWQKIKGNEDKTLSDWDTFTNGAYKKAIKAIQTDYQVASSQNYGDIKGWNFNLPTDYTPFDINNYNWNPTLSRYGGSIRFRTDKLIDKIIKEYESNS